MFANNRSKPFGFGRFNKLNIDVKIKITTQEAVNLLMASIAFEELGLVHIINSGAEKTQIKKRWLYFTATDLLVIVILQSFL
ncbi:MAG TPA: hypothetical protein VFD52_01725 [Clostridia bacterium]|nr:hypothetical protein [Clostridia bacterium]